MNIVTTPYNIVAYLDNEVRIGWPKGSHTAHIYNAFGEEFDVFTFAWHKDRASMLDFTTALVSYLSEE